MYIKTEKRDRENGNGVREESNVRLLSFTFNLKGWRIDLRGEVEG